MTICRLCGRKFKDYQDKHRTRCGACNTKIRRYRAKQAAITMMGGKCQLCGWIGHQAAFQFHHIDTKKKDFILGNAANKSWDSIKSELKKCILLCANCHAIQHSTKNDAAFIKEVKLYRGKRLPLK